MCRHQAGHGSLAANTLWMAGLPIHTGLPVLAELGAEENKRGSLLVPSSATSQVKPCEKGVRKPGEGSHPPSPSLHPVPPPPPCLDPCLREQTVETGVVENSQRNK